MAAVVSDNRWSEFRGCRICVCVSAALQSWHFRLADPRFSRLYCLPFFSFGITVYRFTARQSIKILRSIYIEINLLISLLALLSTLLARKTCDLRTPNHASHLTPFLGTFLATGSTTYCKKQTAGKMPSVDREESRDRELVLKHQTSFSESGRASVPM